jgi:hypothetical protein
MFRTPMTLDRTHRRLTWLSSAFIALALAFSFASRARVGEGALAFGAGALLLAWAMSPRALVVAGGELRVERRAWPPLRIPLATVVSAAPLDRLGGGTLRLFGTGGFFGSYGLFRSNALGRFRLYATRTGQAVLVRRTGGALPLVLTPDDVAGTIDAIDHRPVY